jgi:hypothetical protein
MLNGSVKFFRRTDSDSAYKSPRNCVYIQHYFFIGEIPITFSAFLVRLPLSSMFFTSSISMLNYMRWE